ncbi:MULTISPECIES: hypothetical protein [unclassified Treponema]|uniref:hypothetical protein n=1 Tax=unclassified Treponema TaxID=2638727 RepID=UPI001B07FFF3|nr:MULTISPECIES: hypothetical protein [unclassified Treponema]MBO6219237.1 hypothetical protein [Treponema sp.]MBQ8680757.1 hypothetical protein [Treponema sp.]
MTSTKSVVLDGTFSPRVMELRKKIHDTEYLDYAVQRIAQVLSRKIVEDNEQQLMRRRHESK